MKRDLRHEALAVGAFVSTAELSWCRVWVMSGPERKFELISSNRRLLRRGLISGVPLGALKLRSPRLAQRAAALGAVLLSLSGALSQLGCQGAKGQISEPVSPTKTEAPQKSERELLATALREVELRGPVLEALSSAQRQALEQVVAGFSSSERAELLDEAGPYLTRRPLLYLIAGGKSEKAKLALATSSDAAELLLVTQGTDDEQVAQALPVVRELVERAAAEWLRGQVGLLASERPLSLEQLHGIGLSALALAERDIAALAARLAAELDPSAERFILESWTAIRAGDISRAELALSHVGRGGDPYLKWVIQRMLAAHRRLEQRAAPEAPSSPELISARGRDLLLMEQYQAASELLAPHAASKRLDVQVLRARAALRDSNCPGVPMDSSLPVLCRVAFFNHPEMSALMGPLDAAWVSDEGRDLEAVVNYIALRYAIPFLYGKDVRGKSDDEARQAIGRSLKELGAVLARAGGVSKLFGQIELYIQVLSDVVLSPDEPSAAEAEQWTLKALALRECSGCADGLDRADSFPDGVPSYWDWAPAAQLAVMARVAGQRDTGDLMDQLPELKQPIYRHAKAALMGWSGLAAGDAERSRQAIEQLADFAERGDSPTEVVIELAELQHAVEPSGRTGQVLENAGKRLGQSSLGLELRARGALNAAGVLAARGELEGAAQILEFLLKAGLEPKSRVEKELSEIAQSYLLVLRARLAKGAERAEAIRLLKGRPRSSAIVDEWRHLWVLELARLPQKAACGVNAACLERAARQGRPSYGELSQRVGKVAAKLLTKQQLGLYSTEMSLATANHMGIHLELDFRPVWLAVEVPY